LEKINNGNGMFSLKSLAAR